MLRRGCLPIFALTLVGCVKPGTNTHMWSHFDRALDAHNAVLAGQVIDARAAGQWLIDHPEGDLPRGSETLERRLLQYARELAGAKDMTEAAVNVAGIAEVCGECHRQFGPGPRFAGGGVPVDRTADVSREMQRHAWATGRLWEGLIGPSDAAWMAGARVLKDAPMTPSQLPAREGAEEDIAALERRVHEFGQLSLGASSSERTVIYANLIATCASCHRLVRGS